MSKNLRSTRYLVSSISIPILTDHEFIETMIAEGKKKIKLEDDENQSNRKICRTTIRNEPEQVT